MTVTGRQAASAANAKASSSPNEACFTATKVRMATAARATVPATRPVVNMMFDWSRIGRSHIVAVTFTAALSNELVKPALGVV